MLPEKGTQLKREEPPHALCHAKDLVFHTIFLLLATPLKPLRACSERDMKAFFDLKRCAMKQQHNQTYEIEACGKLKYYEVPTATVKVGDRDQKGRMLQ